MNIEDEIADEVSGIQVGSGYYATTIGIDAAQEVARAVMPLVKRAQAEAWEAARRSVRALPHWYNTDDGYGEFDLQPLGPDETSEQGAFMAVMEILGDNPYIEIEGERA